MNDTAAVVAVRNALAHVVGEGAHVLLAVSGGGDSIGMAHLVTAARPDLRAEVVHIRHGLRPDDADVAAARACAQQLHLPFEAVAVTVVPDGTGPENAARSARMTALVAAARRRGAGFVAVGHTADDQAETVLLNIARGSGLAGLAGMPATRALDGQDGEVLLIRPVLGLRRAQVRAVAAASGLPVAQDPTNLDPAQRRFRARSRLLPLLSDLTGGASDAVESLARLAGHAREDSAALDAIAAGHLRAAGHRWGPAATVGTAPLDAMPLAIRRRVARGLVAQVTPGPAPSQATINRLLSLRDGQAATLPGGLMASRGGGSLAVTAARGALPVRRLDAMVELPELGLVLRRETTPGAGALPPWAPAAAAAAIPVPPDIEVVVRSRRPGDRIRTSTGTQSVAHAMIDAGVPRVVRDLVPVVEDAAGLLWVPGVAVRADARGSLRLRLTSLRDQ